MKNHSHYSGGSVYSLSTKLYQVRMGIDVSLAILIGIAGNVLVRSWIFSIFSFRRAVLFLEFFMEVL